ncbi:MAG TPA: c-type cytochrome [Methylomirabilota bacterium]|nr:c-type cytochrome [Methylomirabilota bacterium]
MDHRGSAPASPPSPARGAVAAAVFLLGALLPAGPARAQTVDERFQVCLGCHGADGQSRIPETPSLGGQPSFFVVAQLFLFREGRRDNEAMVEAAKGLTNADLTAFADRVTRLPPPRPPEEPPDPVRFARGRALTLRHPCGVCHNPDFSGRQQMPRLANQREDYLLKAMRQYQSGARLGYGGAMAQELAGLGDQDLSDLAHFLSHQGAKP